MIDTRDLQRRQIEQWTIAPKWDYPPTEESWIQVSGSVTSPAQSPAETLLNVYIDRAMLRALTKRYSEDGTWFAEVLAIPDVWGRAKTEIGSLRDLESRLRVWLTWKIQDRDADIPPLDGIDLNILS